MAQSGLVANHEEDDDNATNDHTSIKRQLDVTKQTHRATSTLPKDGFDYLSVIRRLYRKWNLSNTTTDLIINSWREGTKSQYKLYFNKWCLYCQERKMNPLQPTTTEAIEFFDAFIQTRSLIWTDKHCKVNFVLNNISDKFISRFFWQFAYSKTLNERHL